MLPNLETQLSIAIIIPQQLAAILHTATLSLGHCTAEYCAPAWCRSAHSRLIDLIMNNAVRAVIKCMRPSATEYLSDLASILIAEHRRRQATLSQAHQAMEPRHQRQSKVIDPEKRPNRLHTKVGRWRSALHNWGVARAAAV